MDLITTNIALPSMLISTLLLCFVGLIGLFQSYRKYKFNIIWIFIGLILFACPPLILILISILERNEIKKRPNANHNLKSKIMVNISVAIFIFYYSLFPLFVLFLKYSSINKEWYQEIAITCINIVMLAFVPLYLYVKKKINILVQ